ncbi:MAG: futalosine hydrolase [Niabella sp.]
MKILLIAATIGEVLPLQRLLVSYKNVDTLITGIGGVATAYALGKKLHEKKYDLLLQAGIAGSFSPELPLGSVVAVSKDCFGDLGVVEKKTRLSVFDMNLMDRNEHPFKKGRLGNPHKELLSLARIKKVSAVSVNEVSTEAKDIRYFSQVLKCDVESMEGAAFHYVALQEGIPFLQIRSISNYVGERNKQKWRMKAAIENLNLFIFRYIHKISAI